MVNQKTADKSKLSRTELGFLILTATVTITIVSTCSPLYPFNPWDDANCFFTVGRGILHGLVPYRDLPENEKTYDRNMVTSTIKILLARGYKIEKTTGPVGEM